MVAIIFAEGFEETEALVPVDLLRRATVNVQMVGVSSMQVTGSHGITVQMDTTLDQMSLEDLEMVVLPGGKVGVANLEKCDEVRKLVLWARENRKMIAAICAAPTLLAKYGILQDVRAVVYPGMESILEENGAKIQWDERVTHDGSIITGQAAGSSAEFALKLIAMLRGWIAADTIRREIHYHGGDKSLT